MHICQLIHSLGIHIFVEVLCKIVKSNNDPGLNNSTVVIISVISTTVAIILMLLGASLFFKQRRESFRRGSEVNSAYSSSSSQGQKRPIFASVAAKRDIRGDDIMEATNNLSNDFTIGSGGSGTVYKAELFNGKIVAIKRIDDLLLDKSFAREMYSWSL